MDVSLGRRADRAFGARPTILAESKKAANTG